ncbi:hypothetical protein DACRYDRAFT_101163 [Dacryopinax primogenitus]|uniref:Uncharacterized protein n=1 Tax=Dacryopinax primogenitus (strain DJM 731) TaxID=1858805 RepID=M5FWS0_DACPD|nr:uncharacterized protein DACRYDRAFT_101163 [Dacryopinax primogenitus]EJU00135.1 hypothetical protein DACRYDRAFT_101163 [Dacryopinax primogenitus]
MEREISIFKSRRSSVATSSSSKPSLVGQSEEGTNIPNGRSITDVLIVDVLELILAMIDEMYYDGLISRLDILSLAKSCKYFHASANPLIYRTITFDCHMNKAIYEKSWSCCNSLAKRPHLAQLVRICIIKDSYDFWDGLDHFPKQWKSVIIPALTNMVNLRELRWQRTSFSPALWKLVGSMEHLESLHLQQCSVRTPPSRKSKKNNEGPEIPCFPSLRNLTLTDLNMRHGDDEVVLGLIDDILGSNRSLSIGANKPIFWRHIQDHMPDPIRLKRLYMLDVGSEMTLSPELVSSILQQTTELTELMVYIHSETLDTVMQLLPKDALPELSVFSGNPAVAKALVPGRAVHTVCLNAAAPSVPIGPLAFLPDPGLNLVGYLASLESLQLSTVQIVHFDLLLPDFETAYEMPIMQQLPDFLPHLRILAVHGPYNGAVNNNRLTEAVGLFVMGRLPYLEDFSFHVNYLRYRSSPGFNLRWQHDLIMEWSKLCPTLSVVQISSVIHWLRSVGQWQPALKGRDAWTRLTEGIQWLTSSNKDLMEYDWNGTLAGWLGDRRWRVRDTGKEPAVLRTLQAAVQRVSLRNRVNNQRSVVADALAEGSRMKDSGAESADRARFR